MTLWASSHKATTLSSGLASTAWCAACHRAFFKAFHRLVQLLAGHRQKGLLQSQFHVGIGQRFFGQLQPSIASGKIPFM